MTISANLENFQGKPIIDFDPQKGIEQPDTYVYRLRIDYETYENGGKLTDLLTPFYQDPHASQVEALIIGTFGYDYDSKEPIESIVSSLSQATAMLPRLKALFIGDITYEEYEISWIEQGNVSPILEAYPQLEYFRIRGGKGLSLGKLVHENLKTLIVEAGGLPLNVIQEVSQAHLPALGHLELWLGSDNYGFDASIQDFESLLQSKQFPRLKYLGLRDSEIADELAMALHNAPILNLLETLDLSLGTLGDKGAQALLDNPAIRKLRLLDLHHHFISDELVSRLQQLGIQVDVSDKMEEEEEGYRYIAVSE
jgi:hypothetical protein